MPGLQAADTIRYSRFKWEGAVLRLDTATGNGALFHPAADIICFPILQPNPVLHYTGKIDR